MTTNEYFQTLDDSLRLFSFTYAGRDESGKKLVRMRPGWRKNPEVYQGDNGLGLVLGRQEDGSFTYCLDFDADYEEAGLVHLEALGKGLELYLEKTLKGGHVIIRTDGRLDVCGKQVIYKTASDGHAICEQLGEGQCVYIYPSPEKERMCGDLNKIIPAEEARGFILDVMNRYKYHPASTAQPAPVHEPRPALAVVPEREGEESALEYFNRSIDLVVRMLEKHDFQETEGDGTALKFYRPGKKHDGDASILLFKTPTKGKNLKIQTLSHHMKTSGETLTPSIFFIQEGYEDAVSLARFADENRAGGREIRINEKATARNIERKRERMNKQEKPLENIEDRSNWFTYEESSNVFTVRRTPAEAIRYGAVNSKAPALAQPSHLFAGVGDYFRQKTEASPKPQRNGAVLAQLASASYVSQRLFASNHTASGVDKPAFYGAFLASSTSGKGNVLDLASDCFVWYSRGFRDALGAIRGSFPVWEDSDALDAIKKAEAEGDEETASELRAKGTSKAFELLENPWSFLDVQTQHFASSQALASCLMRRGSATLIIDEIQDALLCRMSGQSGSNRSALADGFAKQIKELYTLRPEKKYGGSWCKDEQKNDRLVMNPALNIFGTGVNKDDFREWMNSKAEDGFEGRWFIWSGSEYAVQPNLNIQERTEQRTARTRANEAIDRDGVVNWAYSYGRYYALMLFHYSTLEFFDGKKKLVFSDVAPSEVRWEYEAELVYSACSAWLEHTKGLDVIQETILGRSLNKLSNVAILYAVLRTRPEEGLLYDLERAPWRKEKETLQDLRMTLTVTREDVEKAVDVIIWDVIQLGVFNEGNADEERQEEEERSHAEAWKLFFSEWPEREDENGRRFFTWTDFKNLKKNQLRLPFPMKKPEREGWLEKEVRAGYLERVENVKIQGCKRRASVFYLGDA